MTNSAITLKFIELTDKKTVTSVMDSIAAHYGITADEAMDEVTDVNAESLLDYLIEPVRSATHLIMKRHGLA